jgi:hypothetical protein
LLAGRQSKAQTVSINAGIELMAGAASRMERMETVRPEDGFGVIAPIPVVGLGFTAGGAGEHMIALRDEKKLSNFIGLDTLLKQKTDDRQKFLEDRSIKLSAREAPQRRSSRRDAARAALERSSPLQRCCLGRRRRRSVD